MYFEMKQLCAAVCTVCAVWFCSPTMAQNRYFVDGTNGKNQKDGSMKHPFRTIERACEEAKGKEGETVIYLRNGRHELGNTLVLASTDWNGKDGRRLRIESFPGEKAVITGSKILHLRWAPYKDGIMKSDIKGQVSHMDMLSVNGDIRPMARYPNYDSTAVRFNGTAADAIAPERVRTWRHPEGGLLHAMHLHDWGDFHYRIVRKDGDDRLILEGGWQNNRQSGLHPKNRMVENIFEELDAPGEWFYDPASCTLYYYPMPGENIETAVFETPQLKHLVELKGTSQTPVRNISFEDIEFTQTERTFMERYEPLLRSDWTVYRGGAILMDGTDNCHIARCDFHNLGGNGVFLSNFNRNSSVSGSHFYQIGASAVCFVGNPDAVRSPSFEYGKSVPMKEIDRTIGPKTDNYPTFCSASDNLIHHIGLFEKQVTGVELSMYQYITVSHNSIYHTPRAGINISEGTWGGHVIEFNDVFDNVRETGDHGSFNSWGRDRFWRSSTKEMHRLTQDEPELILADAMSVTTIHNNRFRCDRGWDIDLDDGSSNYHIYNNLCLNGGIKLREGFYRVVENNIMINNTFHPHVWFKNSGDVFTHNLVMAPYRPIGVSYWGAEIDYNVFTDSTSYAAARKLKLDEHSIVSKVRFLNPSQGDYRIADISNITALCGFKNFDMNRFGVVSPRLKQLACQPTMPYPSVLSEESQSSLVQWNGLSLKNLDTLGERSATGMDEEHGVYVVAVSVMGNPLRDFVRANDVILAFDGKDTNNLEALKAAVSEADLKKV